MKENDLLDKELQSKILKRLESIRARSVVIATGITSSHISDERNLREYILASEVNNYIRHLGYNTFFYLTDDSFDPLNFRQLRIGVKKDPVLIEKFSSYCGTPISLVPDPYNCHGSYSKHIQSEILARFHALNIFPSFIDIADAYKTGFYDQAKEIIFSKFETVKEKLKKDFPQYTMKKIFWPLCALCKKIDQTEIKEIKNTYVYYKCLRCRSEFKEKDREIVGKFSWKIDCAIKWNLFKTDFEPFNKAYLDPVMGSYVLARYISKEFFEGNVPEVLEYGQVFMEKELSYKIALSLPSDFIRKLFLTDIKRDKKLSKAKLIQEADLYKIDEKLSYINFIKSELPNKILSFELSNFDNNLFDNLIKGLSFSEFVLGTYPLPRMPRETDLEKIDKRYLDQMISIFNWTMYIRSTNSSSYSIFRDKFEIFLIKNQIKRSVLFPKIRMLLSESKGAPLSKNLYSLSGGFIMNLLSLLHTYKKNVL